MLRDPTLLIFAFLAGIYCGWLLLSAWFYVTEPSAFVESMHTLWIETVHVRRSGAHVGRPPGLPLLQESVWPTASSTAPDAPSSKA